MDFGGKGYYTPMDREYHSQNASDQNTEAQVERPIGVKDMGQTVTEGQKFGPFRQSVKAAIHTGARKVELQTQMGGGAEPVGAESYGHQAREELREIGRVNKVEFSSVHAPTQVANLSGYTPRQGGPGDFSDDQRKASVEEIKKAIDFAADVAQGGAVVVHTGEYQRPMVDSWWNENGEFLGYQEEPGRAVTFMVDDRTGKVIGDVRRSQTVREPVYDTAASRGLVGRQVHYTDNPNKTAVLQPHDWVDMEGNYIDPDNVDHLFKRVPKWNRENTSFESRELTWQDFEKRAKEFNERNADKIAQGIERRREPEDMFFKTQLETQILQYRGSSLFHGQRYDDHKKDLEALQRAYNRYKEIEDKMPPEELWKIMQTDDVVKYQVVGRYGFVPPEVKKPSEMLKEAIEDTKKSMKFIHEASASADAQADSQIDTLKHIVPVGVYAEKQSMNSYAEAGIHAMQQSNPNVNPNVKRDIFVAPENIFPEMGYGSHPDELIDLVKKARETMVSYLTKPTIEDPHGRRYSLDEAKRMGRPELYGKPKQVPNKYYQPGISEDQALKEANQHIRATVDTQHLGMWRKHFQPVYRKELGRIETKQETDKRFKKWYMDKVKEMHKADIIGNIHVVDSMGAGHHHLPAGQGDLPVVEAVEWLKKHGYDKNMVSEAYGEEMMSYGRILTETWKAFGSGIYGMSDVPMAGRGGGFNRWEDVHHSYFGRPKPPYYIFGAYSPSNDWTLWSQVPLE